MTFFSKYYFLNFSPAAYKWTVIKIPAQMSLYILGLLPDNILKNNLSPEKSVLPNNRPITPCVIFFLRSEVSIPPPSMNKPFSSAEQYKYVSVHHLSPEFFDDDFI